MTKKMHIIFKTHLDIGFTDLAENVIEGYFTDFIPRALELGEQLSGKFIWTTGSWLIDAYLSSPEVADHDKKRMEAAIEAGTIVWHGLPVTTHTELMDSELFNYGLSLSKKLDKRYGKTTTAAKMTDVPGHTIGMVPLLAKAGINYLHIGVNASSAIPNVPELFLWRAKDGSEIVVQYAPDYGATFQREGWDDLLYFAHSHDNFGPPKNEAEIIALYQRLEKEYPDVELVALSLEAFAEVAWNKRSELPVIEEEIGDSWIHGVGSDPKKIAEYEILLDLRRQWLAEGSMERESQEYTDFSKHLLLVPEHTWGGNGNVFLPDYRNYLIDDFADARERDQITFNQKRETMDFADLMAGISTNINQEDLKNKRSYQLYEASWEEQRAYIQQAISVLSPKHQTQVKECLVKFNEPIHPIGESPSILIGKTYQFGLVQLSFSETGGIQKLQINQKDLLESGKEFGKFSYERFDFVDYTRFLSQYSRLNQQTSSWALVDFAKRGIEAYPSIRHELLQPYILKSRIVENENAALIEFDLKFEESAEQNYGLPKEIRLSYEVDYAGNRISGQLKWQDKKANRMPEAYWLETSLTVANPFRWQMHKLDEPISPYNVVENGNRNMHALSHQGLTYQGIEGNLAITSLEAPLFSFGRRSLLHFDNKQPSLNQNIYLNLYNNIWGTNFTAWFEGDMLYHFDVYLECNE
ncbi:DUF5054 domain-containing protein [Carnobacterium gallinarum]|uniref:DUF5054 domain-containing protein n=1 Tax=Carnobacterium gallinarum TaxID=2749 RepID=UPI000556B2AD|nr:DUF5054 domain-containing protein [Carnobacterium gallinarum]